MNVWRKRKSDTERVKKGRGRESETPPFDINKFIYATLLLINKAFIVMSVQAERNKQTIDDDIDNDSHRLE